VYSLAQWAHVTNNYEKQNASAHKSLFPVLDPRIQSELNKKDRGKDL